MSEFENKATRGSISQIILKALTSGNKYGYEICKEIERLTNGKLILKQPSLYSSLRRMEEQNLISSYWEDSNLGGKRHYYSLTDKGKEYYEENKKNWADENELINSLPENREFEQGEDNAKNLNEENSDENTNLQNENSNSSTLPGQEQHTLVANQENLFNLTRKNNEDIKKITETEENNPQSFFQFDFFEQNIKFVKQESKQKQDITAFKNKFSNMDNHIDDIEPEILEDKNKETNKKILNEDKIERNDVFKVNDETENKKKEESLNILYNSDDKSPFKNILEDNSFALKDEKTQDIVNKNTLNTDEQNTMNKEEITWNEDITSNKNNEPIFESSDYKSMIGKLYNNSQLKDPYEQNKFHTFKEIFPSSQLKQKEITNEEEKNNSELENIIESNNESNIDCDDIKMLNNLYNLQGISIKTHNDIENKKQNKVYTDKNKLCMINSWFITLITLFELIGCYFILKNNNLLILNQRIIYFIGVALTLSYCLIRTLDNLFDRFKLVVISKPFSKVITTRLLISLFLIVTVFAINLAFGMNSLIQKEYLSFWLVPTIMIINFIFSAIIKQFLIKSKAFNS